MAQLTRHRPSRRSLLLAPLAPLRVRPYRLLLLGQTISTVGDYFLGVALPAVVLTQRNETQTLGIILAAYNAPRFLTLLGGGMLSDRIGPRRVMLLADLARAGLAAALTVLFTGGPHVALWMLCALVAAMGACGGVFLPAYSAMTPETLPDEALHSGNALGFASLQLAALAGPLLAGIVIARFMPSVAIGVDAVSFLASALTLALMRDRRAAPPSRAYDAPLSHPGSVPAPHESSQPGIPSAEPSFWRFLRGSQLLRVILVVVVVANLPIEGLKGVALPALAFRTLRIGAPGYALLLAALGAGGLIGSLAAAALPPLPRRGLVALLLLAGDALVLAVLPFTEGTLGAAICLIVWGLTNNLRDTLYITFVQRRLPRELLGRVMGALLFATYSVAPFSTLVIGALVTRFGPVVVFPASGAALLLAVMVGLLPREIRQEQ